MHEMKDLTMQQGQDKYGPRFKTYEYVLAQHAASADSKRGDQAHLGAWFISFHAALTRQWEEAIMSIVEGSNSTGERQLEGMPYFWNLGPDQALGVLNPNFFGSQPGRGPNYTVNDGDFANWPAYRFDKRFFDEHMHNASDSSFTGNSYGWLRSEVNEGNSQFIVRYPLPDGSSYPGSNWTAVKECIETPYNRENYTIGDFTECIDMSW